MARIRPMTSTAIIALRLTGRNAGVKVKAILIPPIIKMKKIELRARRGYDLKNVIVVTIRKNIIQARMGILQVQTRDMRDTQEEQSKTRSELIL
ncbi:MAG: hypothetical protein EZS28_017238 [Streblomastix strix]|uniref:Uncharacterized protein n=1 Tax=Streblomastix strix TaxID=222440 RepID=A0A5J4VXB1_9EUKA|nr:MAG: hypothetical protein EZS28_017238 [Streblomastix strix]